MAIRGVQRTGRQTPLAGSGFQQTRARLCGHQGQHAGKAADRGRATRQLVDQELRPRIGQRDIHHVQWHVQLFGDHHRQGGGDALARLGPRQLESHPAVLAHRQAHQGHGGQRGQRHRVAQVEEIDRVGWGERQGSFGIARCGETSRDRQHRRRQRVGQQAAAADACRRFGVRGVEGGVGLAGQGASFGRNRGYSFHGRLHRMGVQTGHASRGQRGWRCSPLPMR